MRGSRRPIASTSSASSTNGSTPLIAIQHRKEHEHLAALAHFSGLKNIQEILRLRIGEFILFTQTALGFDEVEP
jgi:hypothetical protein